MISKHWYFAIPKGGKSLLQDINSLAYKLHFLKKQGYRHMVAPVKNHSSDRKHNETGFLK